MDIAEITRRYDLATSDDGRQIKELQLEYILGCACNNLLDPKLIQGMLLLVNLPNGWINDYERTLNKIKQEQEERK